MTLDQGRLDGGFRLEWDPTRIIIWWTAYRLDWRWFDWSLKGVLCCLATTVHCFYLLLWALTSEGPSSRHYFLWHLHQSLASPHCSLEEVWPAFPGQLLHSLLNYSVRLPLTQVFCEGQSSWSGGQWSHWSSGLRGRQGCCSHSGCRLAGLQPCPGDNGY